MMDSIELAYRIRRHAIEMTHATHASHIASALSMADILAVLYGTVMHYDSKKPNEPCRDRFILSKGHAGIAVYAALAESGFFSVELLKNYYLDGSNLSGHVSHKNVPGVELSTGALGHGICVAAGMAKAAKLDGKTHHIYTIIGDGENEEGSVWEAALFSAHQKLDNLTIIVDHNQYQAMGTIQEVAGLDNLDKKWSAFGFETVICDGHNHAALEDALRHRVCEKPVCVIANTIKGKGVSFMENELLWHYRDPQNEFYTRAVEELEEQHHAKCSH